MRVGRREYERREGNCGERGKVREERERGEMMGGRERK